MRIAAPAKLNLCLYIIGKRADGFHLLESLVAFTTLGDMLDIEAADTLSLSFAGPFASALSIEGNLVLKAAQALQEHTGTRKGARLTLHKHLPVGAGIGGGSSDAAAALKGLAELWQLSLSQDNMQKLGASIGSDVPVCMHAPHPAWMEGVGECVTPISLPPLYAVLVNPGKPLLTEQVFRRFSGHLSPRINMPKVATLPSLLEFLNKAHNDLQMPATGLLPEIGEVLSALRATGCMLARMSGSGATCFGLYDMQGLAQQAARQLQASHPHWWCVSTELQHG